jgi:endonuclease/exonuclease/phosphatase family metal-dependent hydrolase
MTRICTWVDFGGQLPFAVFNVHLEYQYQETQDRSIGLLRERLDSFPAGYPVLLAGDFNFRPDSAPYRTLSEFACDSYRTGQHRDSSADRATCHSFTGETTVSIPHASRIDYIWGRGSVEMSNHKIINDGADDPAGVFPSDHWPVMCEITIEGR